MSVVIDTDIFIDILRGVPAAKQLLNLLIANEEKVLFSAITEAELLSGSECEQDAQRRIVLRLLGLFMKLPVDNATAQLAGKLRRNSDILLPDALIAAAAILADATLFTRNSKDFKKVSIVRTKKPY